MTPQDLEAALANVPDITRIEIEIIGNEFRWSLFEHGRRIFAGRGDYREVKTMALNTEMLVYVMLGVSPREPRLPWGPSVN
jgi:hypothetical protein